MKIVSWDVGIKNLAYCNLELVDNQVIIHGWDKIDLLEDKRQVLKCKVCNKNATLVGIDGNKVVNYFCGSHKKRYDPQIDINFEENIGVCNYTTSKVCGKKSLWKKNDHMFCNVHKKQYITSIQNETKLKSIKKINSLKNDPQELGICIFKNLDKHPNILDCDTVCIEHQPVLKNPIMKSVAMFIFSYFLMKGTMENKINKVQFISATNKLKVDNDKVDSVVELCFLNDKIKNLITSLITKHDKTKEINDELVKDIIKYLISKHVTDVFYKKIEKDDKNYNLNKDISVVYTKLLLTNQPTWLEHLDKFSKQDDLCDAFLQGYYYLIKCNL